MSEDTKVTTSQFGAPYQMAFKPKTAARLLDISRARLFELIRSGELKSVKYGQTRLIPREALECFLQADNTA